MNFDTIRKDIRRYLGSSTVLDEETEEKMNHILDELVRDYHPRYIHGLYDIIVEKDSVFLPEIKFEVQSKDLAKVMADAEKCVLIACTLGIEIERKLKYYSAHNLELGILYDAIAAAYIEGYLDAVNRQLAEQFQVEGYYMTMRYSPGYGDVDLNVQERIIDVLHAYKRIGLTTNESHLMIPRKSITAFIGLQKKPYINLEDRCLDCRLREECELRKGGKPCGVAK